MKNTTKGRKATLDLCYIALSVALITVCSWISIPVSESVKYTLQLVAVFTCCGLFGLVRGLIAVSVYALMGLIGIPVFAGFGAGPSATTGFVLGFIPTAIVVGLAKHFIFQKVWKNYLFWGIFMLFGLVLTYAVGTIWFMVWTKYDLITTLTFTILPYWVFDLVKIVISLVLVERLRFFIH